MASQSQFIVLTILIPAIGALLCGLVNIKHPRFSLPIALSSLILTIFSGLFLFLELTVLNNGTAELSYYVAGWRPPYGIEFRANTVNSIMAVFIALIASLNLIHSNSLLAKMYPVGRQFYTLYLLLTAAFIGLVLTADIFNLYVFLEITSLASYALIGRGDGRASRAAFNYLIIGTVGASFYLIGVGFLYLKTGTLNIPDISRILEVGAYSETILVAFAFILLGLMIKMAMFPVHNWLPNAYSYCPQPSVGLLSPLATKVALFLVIKLTYELFGSGFVEYLGELPRILVNLSAVGIFFCCGLALAQKNWVKTFCYLVVIEVGYIFGGFWLQNEYGLRGALYHIFTDMLLTLAVFLFVGAVRINYQYFHVSRLKAIFKTFPLVAASFLVVGMTLVGVPPTGGFVTKVYLIKGAFEAGEYFFVLSLLLASITAAIIFFRIIESSFFSKDSDELLSSISPRSIKRMSGVMMIVSGLLILIGVFQSTFINAVILPYLSLYVF